MFYYKIIKILNDYGLVLFDTEIKIYFLISI